MTKRTRTPARPRVHVGRAELATVLGGLTPAPEAAPLATAENDPNQPVEEASPDYYGPTVTFGSRSSTGPSVF